MTPWEFSSIIRETYAQVRSDAADVAKVLYSADELAGLPDDAVVLALGVGHPVCHAGLHPGETVLDLGCGAGIDSLLAALAVGPTGTVIGLDMTLEMLRSRPHERHLAGRAARGASRRLPRGHST